MPYCQGGDTEDKMKNLKLGIARISEKFCTRQPVGGSLTRQLTQQFKLGQESTSTNFRQCQKYGNQEVETGSLQYKTSKWLLAEAAEGQGEGIPGCRGRKGAVRLAVNHAVTRQIKERFCSMTRT